MASNTIPIMTTPITFRLFTSEPAQRKYIIDSIKQITKGKDDASVRIFFAFFINHAYSLVQRERTTDSRFGDAYSIMVVLEDVPVDIVGFLDAMQAYNDAEWRGGVKSGIINLKDGRKPDDIEIEAAQVMLARLVLRKEEQWAQINAMGIPWRSDEARKAAKKTKKDKKRALNRSVGDMDRAVGDMALGGEEGDKVDEDEVEDDDKNDADYVP